MFSQEQSTILLHVYSRSRPKSVTLRNFAHQLGCETSDIVSGEIAGVKSANYFQVLFKANLSQRTEVLSSFLEYAGATHRTRFNRVKVQTVMVKRMRL